MGTFRLAIWQPVNQSFRDPKWHGPQEELPLVSQFNFLYSLSNLYEKLIARYKIFVAKKFIGIEKPMYFVFATVMI